MQNTRKRSVNVPSPAPIKQESGNVLIFILLAIVLIGALTAAIQSTSTHTANIDKETVILRLTEAQRTASEISRALAYIMQNGKSESDIRFSHPDADPEYGDLDADADKTDQVFHRDGGAAIYPAPPSDINDGSKWEFYGNTALPEVGTDAPELIMVLPNVTQGFCEAVNSSLGYSSVLPEDSGTCLNTGSSARFGDSHQFDASPNTVTDTTFTLNPATQGCAQCANNSYNYFYVLMAR